MIALRAWYLVIGAVAFACPVAVDAQQVNRCVVNGKVIYGDAPCATAPTTGGPDPMPNATLPRSKSASPAIPGFYGQWTGQAQFQATAKGLPIEAPHAVVNLTLNMTPDGKVVGDSAANGCRVLGLALPSSPQSLKLDFSLTGCQFAGYNRRYTGTFGLPPGKDYSTVSLVAYDVRPGTPPVMYDITATMRP